MLERETALKMLFSRLEKHAKQVIDRLRAGRVVRVQTTGAEL